MSDRRAVTAGRLTPSVAGEMWRVAVGGNRVENMTVDEIAHAYHAGHLSVRTPLWPPGTSGWQALGNFEHFQFAPGAHDPTAAGHDQYQRLAQFQEGDDDPTRMWTGTGDLEMAMPEPMPVAPSAPPARPSSRTGPRQVPSQAPRPMPMASVRPQQRVVSSAASASPSTPPFRARRGSGWLLVAGLVGLVGLGSAVLAARGNWSSAAAEAPPAAPEVAAAAVAGPAATENTAAEAAPAQANAAAAEPSAPGVNDVAKYEENGASAFVAGGEPNKAADADKAAEPASAEGQASPDGTQAAEGEALATAPEKGKRTSRTASKEGSKAASAPKRSLSSKVSASTSNAKRATAPLASKPKPEPSEDAAPTPAGPSVNEAAATALANSAKLASSCRPRGGPSGPGKARVIYSQDGEVQSVEILTAKFRDTLTGSCVRMVFRRAKIPPFKGEPPTFIKSFTIPEE